jgi:23S rRNA (uracil1939-C5)-methyltransferase
MNAGDLVTVQAEKPAAGGRMVARHQGRVLLVSGAIPGERVVARVERVSRGVVFAEAVTIATASDDRRAPAADPRCGGCVLAHVSYPRQLQLKGEIVHDAFARLAHLPIADGPALIGSPEEGYRTRARFHVREGRVGFYREGSHELCDVAATGQLGEAAVAWLRALTPQLQRPELRGVGAIEMAENVAGDSRACHLELHAGTAVAPFVVLSEGLAGLSAARADRPDVVTLSGEASVEDTVAAAEDAPAVRLRRDVRAFFQGNRFLVVPLARHVAALAGRGRIVDLYGGVGLFGLTLAAAGAAEVTVVEGDPVAGADLLRNAQAYLEQVHVERRSVETYLAARPADALAAATAIVDPPRTGLSKEAVAGLIRVRPATIVYVSCDPATLARDCRAFVDGGYDLRGLTVFDMFPNTPHVETVALLERT